MKLFITLFFAALSFQALSTTNKSDATEEQLLNEKGHAVLCAQTLGVLDAEKLDDELNKELSAIKTPVIVSQPTLSVSLLNIVEKNRTDPGALAVLCVTLTKKNKLK